MMGRDIPVFVAHEGSRLFGKLQITAWEKFGKVAKKPAYISTCQRVRSKKKSGNALLRYRLLAAPVRLERTTP